MGKFKGFRPGKNDSICTRAACALIWLRKQHPDRPFASWAELFAAATGTEPGAVNHDEVLTRLRRNGAKVKLLLRERGYGVMSHPSDRGLLRACDHGEDSLNGRSAYRQRAIRATETLREYDTMAIGNPKDIIKTKENAAAIEEMIGDAPGLRGLLRTLGVSASTPEKKRAVA